MPVRTSSGRDRTRRWGNEAGGIAKVVTCAIMDHDVDGVAFGNEESDGVGKLQLPGLAGSDTVKEAKMARSKR